MSYDRFLYSLESRLKKVYSGKNLKPDELYEPQRYILSLGGKKLRPLLSLIAADLFDANINKAMPSAIGVELFHNFSLIHDDILDKAPLRRGKQ
ncbi:MAG: polyprenyl synthetase family protein, partial [Bacteroidota bacterium]